MLALENCTGLSLPIVYAGAIATCFQLLTGQSIVLFIELSGELQPRLSNILSFFAHFVYYVAQVAARGLKATF
jgi:hypothetical protein